MDASVLNASLFAFFRRRIVAVPALSGAASAPAWLDHGHGHLWAAACMLPIVVASFFGTVATAVVTVAASLVFLLGAVMHHSPLAEVPWATIGIQLALFALVAITTMLLNRRRDTQRVLAAADAAEARNALDVQHMINAAYDIDVTMDMVLLKMRELVRADSYAVMLTENNHLRVRGSSGLGPAARDVWLPATADDHGWTPAEGRPLAIADVDADDGRSPLLALEPRARSVLAVPLQSVERMVGLLAFFSREPNAFGTREVDTVAAFANQVVFPVQRAIMEEDLKRLAFTDTQTSLFNHRHFQTQLDEEVRRAQRYGRPLALLMLDLDDFKSLNDAYGHPAGDHVLREVAEVLRATLRNVDFAARYGGEEFAVVCPETTKAQAIVLAERLRVKVQEMAVTLGDDGPRRITVSVGVAGFPDDAAGKTELIDAADRALYEAKRAGKNRVEG